jgi:hypothetical protein
MDRNDLSLLGFLLLVGGSILIVVLTLSGAFDVPSDDAGWIYHYQTLIAGALAFLGAMLTVVYLARQLGREVKSDRLLIDRVTDNLIVLLRQAHHEYESAADLNSTINEDLGGMKAALKSEWEELLNSDDFNHFARLQSANDRRLLQIASTLVEGLSPPETGVVYQTNPERFRERAMLLINLTIASFQHMRRKNNLEDIE